MLITNTQNSTTKGELVAKAQALDLERQQIQKSITSILTSQGDLEDKHLETGSVNIHYFVWLFNQISPAPFVISLILEMYSALWATLITPLASNILKTWLAFKHWS